MWNWELSLREQANTIIKSIYRNLFSVHLTFFYSFTYYLKFFIGAHAVLLVFVLIEGEVVTSRCHGSKSFG